MLGTSQEADRTSHCAAQTRKDLFRTAQVRGTFLLSHRHVTEIIPRHHVERSRKEEKILEFENFLKRATQQVGPYER